MRNPLPKRKVVVRHLPPSLSQSDFLSQIDARFADRYNWFAFRPGKSSHKNQKYSRAYIAFKTPEDVYEFAGFFNGHVFVNEKGVQMKAIVEYAPSQRTPKPCDKKDPREGSIHKDPDYLEFLKLISHPVENLPSAEIQLERREAEQSGATKELPIVTPLMDFIRQKRAAVIGSQGLSDVRRAGRKAKSISGSRASKRNSEKKKYVEKESLKNVTRKAKPAYTTSTKQDDHQSMLSGKELSENQAVSATDSSLPGIALTIDSGKKKILLLKAKDRANIQNPPSQSEKQIETNHSGSSYAPRQSQKSDVGERLVRGILLKNEQRPSQSSSFVQPEHKVQSSDAENKQPPRPANTRAGKDYHVSGTISEKQDRRLRNKEKSDRVVWAPFRRSDGSNISEDQLTSSAEIKDGTFFQRSGEVGHHLENGSVKNTSRRIGGRIRKEDNSSAIGEGKFSRRGNGGSNQYEKQMWVQKSSSG